MRPGSVIVDMAAALRRQRRRLRRGRARRHEQRRRHPRLHRSRRAPAGAGVAALRHQRGQPAEAGDSREGRRARAGLRGCRAALDHGHPRRRDHLAAAAGAGLGGAPAAASPPGRARRARRRRNEARAPCDHPDRRAASPSSPCNAVAPAPLPQHFIVLALSVVVGFYVIGNVAHALHTPLMSVTNAISGIIVVGAMLQIGDRGRSCQVRRWPSRCCWRASTSSVASP